MVFGKRQILMSTLVLALGVAIYLHSTFNLNAETSDKVLDAAANANSSDSGNMENGSSEKNYGDTQFVTAVVDDEAKDAVNQENSGYTSDYFMEARLNRQQSRDSAIETLQTLLESVDITDDEKNSALTAAAEIATAIDMETNIETLVKAKGFEDCMAFIDEGKAKLIVKTSGLLASEAAQIKDIIVSETGISSSYISILEVG